MLLFDVKLSSCVGSYDPLDALSWREPWDSGKRRTDEPGSHAPPAERPAREFVSGPPERAPSLVSCTHRPSSSTLHSVNYGE